MTLQDVSWRPAYESGFGRDETLMDAFCRPFLGKIVRLSGLAGDIPFRSHANAIENMDSLAKTEAQERAVADGLAKMRRLRECYYWPAKAGSPTLPNGVKKLRTLPAEPSE